MHEHNDLYRRYKADRKREQDSAHGTSDRRATDEEFTDFSSDEISMLYRQYRQQRDPDFEDSIAMVMQVAREKIETETAVRGIVAAAVLPAVAANELTETASPQTGLIRTVLTAPGRAFDSVKASMAGAGSRKWIHIAVPVAAAAVIAVGVFGYLTPDRNLSLQADSFDLAFVDADDNARAETVSGFLSRSAATSLGFTGVFNDEVKAFYLGVHSVDLQVAVLAKKQALIESAATQLNGLLAEGAEVTAQLDSMVINSDVSPVDTFPVLKSLQESQGSLQPWYDWGRDVQSVHYSSQLALDKGVTEPLMESIEGFAEQFQQLDETELSDPEIRIAGEINSLLGQSDFTPDQLRSVRDSAKDIIALRRQSAQ